MAKGESGLKLTAWGSAVRRFLGVGVGVGLLAGLVECGVISLVDAGTWGRAGSGLIYDVRGPWQLVVHKLFAYGWLIAVFGGAFTLVAALVLVLVGRRRTEAGRAGISLAAGMTLSVALLSAAAEAGWLRLNAVAATSVLGAWPVLLGGIVLAALLWWGLSRTPVKRVAEAPYVFYIAVAAWLVAAAASFFRAPDTRPVPRGPNVVLITVDSWRADCIDRRADGTVLMPNVRRFATGATTFRHCAAAAPWTLPALSSLHTGLYVPVHRAGAGYRTFLMPDFDTLAEVLYRHGYDTAGIPSNLFTEPRFGLAQGFDYYRGLEMNDFLLTSRVYYTLVPVPFMSAAVYVEGMTPVVTHNVLRYLNKRRGPRPFFLWTHYFFHHYNPPPAYVAPDVYRRWQDIKAGRQPADDWLGRVVRQELYNGEIRRVDDEVERILQTINKMGIGNSTIVIISADHGEGFWEHGLTGHGNSVYPEVVNIPLIIYAPGVVPAGTVVDTQVSQIDVFATVLDLVGVPADKPNQSRSLVPVALGRTDGYSGMAFSSAPMRGDTSLITVTDARRGAVYSAARHSWEFYDLTLDPYEKHPVREPLWRSTYENALRDWQRDNDACARRYNVRYREDKMITSVMRAFGYIK